MYRSCTYTIGQVHLLVLYIASLTAIVENVYWVIGKDNWKVFMYITSHVSNVLPYMLKHMSGKLSWLEWKMIIFGKILSSMLIRRLVLPISKAIHYRVSLNNMWEKICSWMKIYENHESFSTQKVCHIRMVLYFNTILMLSIVAIYICV